MKQILSGTHRRRRTASAERADWAQRYERSGL